MLLLREPRPGKQPGPGAGACLQQGQSCVSCNVLDSRGRSPAKSKSRIQERAEGTSIRPPVTFQKFCNVVDVRENSLARAKAKASARVKGLSLSYSGIVQQILKFTGLDKKHPWESEGPGPTHEWSPSMPFPGTIQLRIYTYCFVQEFTGSS